MWVIEIILCFFRSDGIHWSFKKVAGNYIKSGNFLIDSLATFPTLLTLQENDAVNFLKFLRLRDFFVMFSPIIPILEKFLPNGMDTHVKKNITNFITIIVATILIAHYFCCVWLYLGLRDIDKTGADRLSWACGNDFQGLADWELYVFGYYWIFEVLTTVGYGDYTPGTR